MAQLKRRPWLPWGVAAILAAGAAIAGSARAQISIEPPGGGVVIQPPGAPIVGPPPETAPASAPATGPSAENVLEELLRQHGADATSAPGASGTAGATEGTAPEVGSNGLFREGEQIKDRSARLKRDDSTGATMVLFDTKGVPIPPMAAVPSRMLELMENAAGFGDPKNTVDLVFPIDAQVTEYRGKNYLLLNQPAAAMPRPPAPMPPATMPDTVAGILPQPKIDPVAPNAPPPAKMGEGDLIEQRTGRFVKDARTGAEIIVFDADGKHMLDQPMGLIPCQYLAVMEDESENGLKPVKFRVSGLVTQYRGKNFLYPLAVTVIRDLHGGVGG